MAARRLIAVMLVLLFLSSLAAALAPVEPTEETTSTATEPTPAPDSTADRGRLLRRSISADPTRPPTVKAKVGDQLRLRVRVKRPTTLELVRLGPTADADPLVPARFDLLLDADGSFPIRELETARQVGVIEVSPRAPRAPGADLADGRS